MPDPHDNKDDDTIIIKPLTYTGSILLSAGAGLLAGLLICWFVCPQNDDADTRQAIGAVSEIGQQVDSAERPRMG